jgi:hypothetical protein
MILIWTNRPFEGRECHSWYQSHYGYNTSCMVLFSKTLVRIRLDAHIRTIVVLTGGKLTGIYLLYLLFVTTHLRQGKKVSVIPPDPLSQGDVNPGLVASR